MKKLFCALTLLAALCACADQEGEWFDTPFVRIATSTGTSSTVVLSDVQIGRAHV